MKWFKHDSDAYRDAKLKKVKMRYGMEGYGLYWYCIELIASSVDQYNVTFELSHDAEIISHDTGIHQDQVQEMMGFMVEQDLFEDSGGIITCMKLAKRLDQSMTSNPHMREIIKKSHDSVMIKSSQTRLDKIRLEDNTAFIEFWKVYPKKSDKKKAETAFNRLTKEGQAMATKDCQTRFTETDKQYIPLATTYIHGERWNDEKPEDDNDMWAGL